MSQIESLSQIEEKLNNLSLTAKNNIDNSPFFPNKETLNWSNSESLFAFFIFSFAKRERLFSLPSIWLNDSI